MKHAIVCSMLLTILAAAPLQAQPTDANYPDWLKGKLADIADVKAAPEKRTAARDEVIRSVTLEQIARAGELARQILPAMNSQDPATSTYACQIAANVRHVYLVPTLTEGLKSSQATVRYWSAKGLAGLQVSMMGMGGDEYFDKPVAALGAQGVKETDRLVLEEIFRALGVANADEMAKPTNARRRTIIYKAFMDVFRGQSRKLEDSRLDWVKPVLAGVDSAAQWGRIYRQDNGVRPELIRTAGQILAWASQIYALDNQNLSEPQKADLEDLMLRSSRLVADLLLSADSDVAKMPWVKTDAEYPRDVTDPPLTTDAQKRAFSVHGWVRAKVRDGDELGLAQHVLDWFGGPGAAEYKVKSLGIAPAAGVKPKDAPSPTSAPQEPAEGN